MDEQITSTTLTIHRELISKENMNKLSAGRFLQLIKTISVVQTRYIRQYACRRFYYEIIIRKSDPGFRLFIEKVIILFQKCKPKFEILFQRKLPRALQIQQLQQYLEQNIDDPKQIVKNQQQYFLFNGKFCSDHLNYTEEIYIKNSNAEAQIITQKEFKDRTILETSLGNINTKTKEIKNDFMSEQNNSRLQCTNNHCIDKLKSGDTNSNL